MQKQITHTGTTLFVFFSLASLEALICTIYLLTLPADPKNALVLGYSLPRLIILLILIFLSISGMALTIVSRRNSPWVSQIFDRLTTDRETFRTVLLLSGGIFIAGWAATLTPGVYFGPYSSYFTRIRPGLVWLSLFSMQTTLLLLLFNRSWHMATIGESRYQKKKVLFWGAILLICFLAIWLMVALSRTGLTPDLFWGKTGVPLLNLQILLALLVGLVFLAVYVHYQKGGQGKALQFLQSWKFDLLICLVLWLAAAAFWIRQPLLHNHFAPGPYPPNNEFYPYSDAASYDLAAQFALIGQGFTGFKEYIDKPLYSAFLLFLHVVMGQSYERVIALQVVFLAVLPALLYLIGRQLFNRAAGVIAGLLAIFKGVNSIAGTLVIWDVSNPKMMMSEYPLAVALALFTLLMILWLKDPEKRLRYLMASGGVIGLATLIRHNTWILLAAAWFILLLAFGLRWKKWLRAGVLFTLVLIVSILPWMWQSGQMNHDPFYFLIPLRGVVLNNRYLPYLPKSVSDFLSPPQKQAAVAVPSTPNPNPTVIPHSTGKAASSSNVKRGNLFQSLNDITAPIADNFFHDLVTSTLTLPSSFLNEDIQGLVRQEQPSSFWNTIWDGRMNPLQGFLIFLDLTVLAVGIAGCWQRWKLAGLVPLITFLAYCLGTAVARTSGGRYIVPADWAIYFYYGLGLLELGLWGAAFFGWQTSFELPEPVNNPDIHPGGSHIGLFSWQPFAILAGFFVIGALIPLPQYLFRPTYAPLSKPAIVQMLANRGAVAKTNYALSDLQQFATGKLDVVAYGQVLYPRYLDFESDDKAKEVSSGLPRTSSDLTFDLIGPGGLLYTVLPMKTAPGYFPNAAEAVVVGCKTGNFVNPFIVVLLSPKLTVYQQDLALPASCPTQ